MLGSIITMTEEIVQKGKVLVQTVMYTKKLKEKKVSIWVNLYENLQMMSWMPLPPDTDFLVEEINCTHLQCSVWLNALKDTLLIAQWLFTLKYFCSTTVSKNKTCFQKNWCRLLLKCWQV